MEEEERGVSLGHKTRAAHESRLPRGCSQSNLPVASGIFLLKACGAVRRGRIHEVGVSESFMVISTS